MTLFINEMYLQESAAKIVASLYARYTIDYLAHWIHDTPIRVSSADHAWLNTYFVNLSAADKLLLLSYIRIGIENILYPGKN